MHLGNFEVRFRDNVLSGTKSIYVFQKFNGYTEYITRSGGMVRAKTGEKVDPDELEFAEMSYEQLVAFSKALSAHGIKPDEESVAQGKLIATERHLEDMRIIALSKYEKLKDHSKGVNHDYFS